MGRRTLHSVLLGTLFFFVQAPSAQVTEAEAHILSAFMTTADPGVFAEVVTVGPELRKDVGPEPESRELYQAIAAHTAGKTLRVQFPSPAESASYRAIAGANANDPFLTLDSGEMRFVLQYAPKQKRVGFVEQLGGDPLPRLAQRKRPALAKAPAAAERPRPRPPAPEAAIDPSTPRGECVIKPVMSALDMWNCSGPSAPADLPPPVAPAPAPAPAPVPAPAEPARARGECVIKPVMSDDDLRNCVGVTASTPPVFPVAAAALVSFAPAPSVLAPRECVIKPIMSDEDLRVCAAASYSAPRKPPPAEPARAAVTAAEPVAPKPPAQCVIKPVMTDEELRTCAALSKSTPSVPPAAPTSVAAVQTESPAPKPAAECIIKPVMSDQDLLNCASVSRSGGLLLVPIAVEKPTPAAAPVPAEPRPRPECVIKPVMSDADLRACGARR